MSTKAPRESRGAFCFSLALPALLLTSLPPASAQAEPSDLALQLFSEGNWLAARAEARRVLLVSQTNETTRLVEAVCRLRCGMDADFVLQELSQSEQVSSDARCMAAYELGRDLWKRGLPVMAFPYLRQAFQDGTSRRLFLRAGCTLYLFLRQYPELSDSSPGLDAQLASCRRLWTKALSEECAIAPGSVRSASWTVKPAEWLISFYRHEIGPAIGQRCSLTPSCSEYARQALRAHGLLVGLAMFADRSVREPEVVANQAEPVMVNGRWRYRDSIGQHDWWMRPEYRKAGAGK